MADSYDKCREIYNRPMDPLGFFGCFPMTLEKANSMKLCSLPSRAPGLLPESSA